MWAVFKLQWLRLFKRPILLFAFIGLTIGMVFLMGGTQANITITIPTFSNELATDELDEWIDHLNEDETFHFTPSDHDTVYDRIRLNETPFALEINEDDYNFILGREDLEVATLYSHVNQVFSTQKRIQAIEENSSVDSLEVEEFIVLETTANAETISQGELASITVLTGISLYFSIYTIMFLMVNLLEEKRKGTWNRLIFSSLSKIKIYLGQLLHYFLVGLLQVVSVFVILKFLLNLDLGNNYLAILIVISSFVFTIVSLGMLVIAVVTSPPQLQVVIPLISTAMAMIGGAFWPLEIVTNEILLFLARLMPIYYGITGLRGAILHNQGVMQLLEPIGMLLLMGVLFMGIGINMMERVSERRSL